MNKLDKQYTDLLQTILDYGVDKKDRTGTGTKSIFGYTIRHNMKDGFPLLTTKKMYMKGVITELLWFLRGDTNIKFLVDNNCHIWNGDAFKNYLNTYKGNHELDMEGFVNAIKTSPEFTETYGDLGPVYGKQWRSWATEIFQKDEEAKRVFHATKQIDQIANLIKDLKTNPDSRRLMVNAWNVGELDSMVLPPCHYGFQVYTRELNLEERRDEYFERLSKPEALPRSMDSHEYFDSFNIPTRAISLMWNQRSVDTFLGLPFNIASYGLLLEIIAKAVNMVPDQLIGNLGDTHLYSNHIEQAKEQIGRELRVDERVCMCYENTNLDLSKLQEGMSDEELTKVCDEFNIPTRTRTPFELPTLEINSGNANWQLLDDFNDIINSLDPELSFKIKDYESHPVIKAPLSN